MLPVLHGDVVTAARVLLAAPRPERGRMLARMLEEADWADAFRRRTGRIHRLWGDGSLRAAAAARPRAAEPPLDDPDYCRCLLLVFEALLARRAGLSRRRRRRRRAVPWDRARAV
jgi:hypothetical protein